jgi:hypothetical protein
MAIVPRSRCATIASRVLGLQLLSDILFRRVERASNSVNHGCGGKRRADQELHAHDAHGMYLFFKLFEVFFIIPMGH